MGMPNIILYLKYKYNSNYICTKSNYSWGLYLKYNPKSNQKSNQNLIIFGQNLIIFGGYI